MECGERIWIWWLIYTIGFSLAINDGPSDSEHDPLNHASQNLQFDSTDHKPRELSKTGEIPRFPALEQLITSYAVRKLRQANTRSSFGQGSQRSNNMMNPPSSFGQGAQRSNNMMYPPFFQNPWVKWGMGIANSVAMRSAAEPWARNSPALALWQEFYRNTPYANGGGYGNQFYNGYGQFPQPSGNYPPPLYEPYSGVPPERYPPYNQQPYRDQPFESIPLQQTGRQQYRGSTVQSPPRPQNIRKGSTPAVNVLQSASDGASTTRLNTEQARKSDGPAQANAVFKFTTDAPVESNN